jgi:hypothetical protein
MLVVNDKTPIASISATISGSFSYNVQTQRIITITGLNDADLVGLQIEDKSAIEGTTGLTIHDAEISGENATILISGTPKIASYSQNITLKTTSNLTCKVLLVISNNVEPSIEAYLLTSFTVGTQQTSTISIFAENNANLTGLTVTNATEIMTATGLFFNSVQISGNTATIGIHGIPTSIFDGSIHLTTIEGISCDVPLIINPFAGYLPDGSN